MYKNKLCMYIWKCMKCVFMYIYMDMQMYVYMENTVLKHITYLLQIIPKLFT